MYCSRRSTVASLVPWRPISSISSARDFSSASGTFSARRRICIAAAWPGPSQTCGSKKASIASRSSKCSSRSIAVAATGTSTKGSCTVSTSPSCPARELSCTSRVLVLRAFEACRLRTSAVQATGPLRFTKTKLVRIFSCAITTFSCPLQMK